MTLSSTMLITARRLIRKYGQNIQFDRVVEGAFIPTTGGVGASVETGYYAYGVPQPTPNREVNGTTVLETDNILWLEVDDIKYVPMVGDVATFSGQAYRILAVTNYPVQGVDLLYKLQLRI